MKIDYSEPRFDRPLRRLIPGTVFSYGRMVLIVVDDANGHLDSERLSSTLIPCLDMESATLTLLDGDSQVTARSDAVLTFDGNISTN